MVRVFNEPICNPNVLEIHGSWYVDRLTAISSYPAEVPACFRPHVDNKKRASEKKNTCGDLCSASNFFIFLFHAIVTDRNPVDMHTNSYSTTSIRAFDDYIETRTHRHNITQS